MKYLFFILLLLQSLFGLSQVPSGLEQGATGAIVIGISDYQDEDIPELCFADKDAKFQLNKFLELNPNSTLVYPGLVKLFLKTDRLEEAKECIEKTIELSPEEPGNFSFKSIFELKNNRPAVAWKQLELGLENGFNELEKLQSESDFDELRKDPKWNKLIKKSPTSLKIKTLDK